MTIWSLDVLEDLEFNMVRGFRLTGKNIRIKLQTAGPDPPVQNHHR
ncbi:MAG: hypothetical protein R2874_10735 [Desulfobacterales bacterium]